MKIQIYSDFFDLNRRLRLSEPADDPEPRRSPLAIASLFSAIFLSSERLSLDVFRQNLRVKTTFLKGYKLLIYVFDHNLQENGTPLGRQTCGEDSSETCKITFSISSIPLPLFVMDAILWHYPGST